MNILISAKPQQRSAFSGRVGAIALAGALVASMLALMPNLGGAQATTVPPLAWGNNDHGQLGPNGPQPFTATPVEVPGLGDVTQVSAGLGHTLARRADGTVLAWGRNSENQLGDGESVYSKFSPDRPAPVQVKQRTEVLAVPPSTGGTVFANTHTIGSPQTMTGVKAVAAGWYHSLAVKNDGKVWAWGENYCGQLGNGKVPSAVLGAKDLSPPAAVEVTGLSGIDAVAAGRGHSLALDEDSGVLWAWGDNRWGQLGNGASRPASSTSGPQTKCELPDGGPVGYGQVVPTQVQLQGKVVAFAAGSDHSLALTEDGTVWSWGNNCSGQLGSRTDVVAPFRSVPAPVVGLETGPLSGPPNGAADRVKALAAGGGAAGGHSLARTAGGKVWAWGLDDVLGTDGSAAASLSAPCNNLAFTESNPDLTEDSLLGGQLTPSLVLDSATAKPLSSVTSLDTGVFHALAVQGDGDLFAWGRNDVGQIASVVAVGETAFTAVEVPMQSVAAVSAGSHSLALLGLPTTEPTTPATTPGPATLSVNDVTVPAEGGAGTTTQAVFTVSLSKPQPAPFTVRAITAEYTAHPLPHESNDYVHVNQLLSFGPNETSKQVAVTINGDHVDERDEIFTMALEESTGPQRVKRQGVGVITNDDGLPTMSINDVTLAEGNAGTTKEARFTVSLGQSSFRQIKVDYATLDGTARSTNHGVFGAADYNSVAGTLTFAPGETTKTVVVVVKGDNVAEQDEQFVVNLSNNINATTTKRTAVGTIRNDD